MLILDEAISAVAPATDTRIRLATGNLAAWAARAAAATEPGV